MAISSPTRLHRSAGGVFARPAGYALIGLLVVVLAAGGRGGGGGGGGGGDGANDIQLQVMLINLSKTDAVATSTAGGDPKTVKACDFDEVDFPLEPSFVFNVNDKPVIDSSKLPGGLPGNGNSFVLAEVTVDKDGTAEVTAKPYAGRAGGLSRPSALFVQGSCAK